MDLRQVDLAFLISERIDSVLVDEGDTVVPGQKLATLETVRLQQAADEARQTAEAARQNYLRVKNGPRAEEIAQARANVQAAEATLNNAGVRSKRLVALAETKSISRQEADDAIASQQVAAANLDVARKQLELLLAGSRVEDIAQALAQYNQAKANLTIREPEPERRRALRPQQCRGAQPHSGKGGHGLPAETRLQPFPEPYQMGAGLPHGIPARQSEARLLRHRAQ